MVEIDVEAVESIEETDVPAPVDAPEYVLYGGKGGVGKTTCAAATGLASSHGGTSTLLVSTDPAHSLSDVLETDIPSQPTRIREDVPLFAVEIDPSELSRGPFGGSTSQGNDPGQEGFDEAQDRGGGFDGKDLSALLGSDVNPLGGGTMPGADEAAAMQLLLEYLDDPRFDRVVVDTAPTGHTLRLLELPEVMDSMVGQLMRFRQKLSGLADSIGSLGGLFGDGDVEGVANQGMADLDELSSQIERLRTALRDPSRTDFRVVTVPETMSVVEADRLIDRLEGFDIPVHTVVVNRVSEDLADVADVDTDWFVAPDTEHCEFCRRRWEVQREALSRAQDLFRGRDVKRVPLFAREVRGEAMLRVVGSCLE